MSIILNCTPSVKGATGLPRMCAQPVGDGLGPRHLAVQDRTVGVRKLCWWQSVHPRVVHYNEGRSESYT